MKQRININVSELSLGQRFFYGTMWYDFVSATLIGSFYKTVVNNGYDDRVFTILVDKNCKVAARMID